MTKEGAREEAERRIRKSRVREMIFFIGFSWGWIDQALTLMVDLIGMSRSF